MCCAGAATGSALWFFIAIVCFAGATITLIKRKPLTVIGTDLLLAAAFCGAALIFLEKSSLFPYYIVYFSVWPIMCIAILTERYRRQFQPVAIILAVVWCSSAAWNLLRLREAATFHAQLSHRALIAELKKEVPSNATIVTSSALYAIPIEAGYSRRGLISFNPLQEDVCHECYLLIPQALFDEDNFIPRSNLSQRKVLFDGPAFPKAGPLDYPVVILSPENSSSAVSSKVTIPLWTPSPAPLHRPISTPSSKSYAAANPSSTAPNSAPNVAAMISGGFLEDWSLRQPLQPATTSFQSLSTRPPDPAESLWRTEGHQCRRLSSDTYLLTYTLHQGQRITRRTTVWRQTTSGWQALFPPGNHRPAPPL